MDITSFSSSPSSIVIPFLLIKCIIFIRHLKLLLFFLYVFSDSLLAYKRPSPALIFLAYFSLGCCALCVVYCCCLEGELSDLSVHRALFLFPSTPATKIFFLRFILPDQFLLLSRFFHVFEDEEPKQQRRKREVDRKW